MTETPARYRQRPIEAEAIQWTGSNADALRAFAGIDFDTIDPADRIEDPDQDAQLLVEASHWVGIGPGDWVLKFEGYFVAKSDVPFRAVWEPAEPAAVPSAPAARAALRDRIAAALYERERPPRDPAWADAYAMDREVFEPMADAVLAVLPEAADRTALSDIERRMLEYALNLADAEIEHDDHGISDDEQDALADLRRLVGNPQLPTTAPARCGQGIETALGTYPCERDADHRGDCDERTEAELMEQQPASGPSRMADEAQPPHHRWYVETRDGVADQWAPGTRFTDHAEATERYEHVTANWPTWKDGTPVERRLVQETTSYTVLATHGVPHVGGNAEDCAACTGTNPDYPFICPGPDDAAQQPKEA